MRVILNPAAGRGAASILRTRLLRLFHSAGLKPEFVETDRSLHATELARQAVADGCATVVVVGGDGSVREVAKAIVNTDVVLGIIPVGTGNDVARTLRLPLGNIERAVEIIVAGCIRPIDVGLDQGELFVSMLGIGFPALVAREANRMRRLKGVLAYSTAVYKALIRMKASPVTIRMDDQEINVDATSVLVQNTCYTGGGLLIAPGAEESDGYLDIVVVNDIGRLNLMLNFPRVVKGRHLSHPSFSLYRSRKVEVVSARPLEKIFDGDPLGNTPACVEVLPNAVKVIARVT